MILTPSSLFCEDTIYTPELVQTIEHTGSLSSVVFSPDGKVLATRTNIPDSRPLRHSAIRLLSTNTWDEVASPLSESSTQASLSFSSDSSYFMIDGFTVRVVRIPSCDLLWEHKQPAGSPVFAQHDPLVAVCKEKGIALINIKEGIEIGTKLAGDEYSILCSSPNGKWIAAIKKADRELQLVDSKTWAVKEKIALTTKDSLPIQWASDGTCLSLGQRNPEIIMVEGGRSIRHKEWEMVSSGPLTNTGKYLITATPGRGAHFPDDHADFRVLNIESGGLVATMRLHGGLGCCAALSPDGQLMATGGWDRKVKIWKLDFSKMDKNAPRP